MSASESRSQRPPAAAPHGGPGNDSPAPIGSETLVFPSHGLSYDSLSTSKTYAGAGEGPDSSLSFPGPGSESPGGSRRRAAAPETRARRSPAEIMMQDPNRITSNSVGYVLDSGIASHSRSPSHRDGRAARSASDSPPSPPGRL